MFHMSDHHLAKGLSLSSVHNSGIHSLLIPANILFQAQKHTSSKLFSHFMSYRITPSVRHRAIEVHYSYYCVTGCRRAVCKSLMSSRVPSPYAQVSSQVPNLKAQVPSQVSSLKAQVSSQVSSPKSKWASRIKSHEQIQFLERIRVLKFEKQVNKKFFNFF